METGQDLQVRDCSPVERYLDGVEHASFVFLAVAAMRGLSAGCL